MADLHVRLVASADVPDPVAACCLHSCGSAEALTHAQKHRGSVPGARATHLIEKAFPLPRGPCFLGLALLWVPSEALFPTQALLSVLLKTPDDKMSPNSRQHCCTLMARVLPSVEVGDHNLFLIELCYLP